MDNMTAIREKEIVTNTLVSLVNEGYVTSDNMIEFITRLFETDQADIAMKILEMQFPDGSDVLSPDVFKPVHHVYAICRHAGEAGNKELIEKILKRFKGRREIIVCALRGALSGDDSEFVDDLIKRFIKRNKSTNNDTQYARSIVVCASEVDNVEQFKKVFSALRGICYWNFRICEPNKYKNLKALERGEFKKKSCALSNMMRGCISHTHSQMIEFFNGEMGDKLRPDSSLASFHWMCKMKRFENAKWIMPSIGSFVLAYNLKGFDDDDVVDFLLKALSELSIPDNAIEFLEDAVHPRVVEFAKTLRNTSN